MKLENPTYKKHTENFSVNGFGMSLLSRPGSTVSFYGDLRRATPLVLQTCFVNRQGNSPISIPGLRVTELELERLLKTW